MKSRPNTEARHKGGKMFDRWDEAYPIIKKVVGAMIALMVLCVLLFGFLQYRNGSPGSALASVGFVFVVVALFMPGPRWLKAGLQLLGIVGFVGGAVMLDMSLLDTVFISIFLGIVLVPGWFGNDEPPSRTKKSSKGGDTASWQPKPGGQADIRR
jgi:hypothetical protein